MRNPQLKEGYIYHIFTKSIAGFTVFRTQKEYIRFIETVNFYRYLRPPSRFSEYLRLKQKDRFFRSYLKDQPVIVDVLAYCIMPTHVHLLLSQTYSEGVSRFMKHILDSYTRYFNTKTDRKGPLWQSRFKHVLIETEEQLMHTSRYIHLNPTTDRLAERPEDWKFSSYREFIGIEDNTLCQFDKYIKISPEQYKKFVEHQIEYQQALKTHTSEV